jgi:DNA-binding response OmpR family regulator
MPDADVFLEKPFNKDEFLRAIRDLMSRSEAAR